MAYQHPIGEEHPFPKIQNLAQAEGFDQLEMVNVYDGALIRLFVRSPDIVFKLQGDPGSAIDRQRFDYFTHVSLEPASPEEMLKAIKHHIRDETTN